MQLASSVPTNAGQGVANLLLYHHYCFRYLFKYVMPCHVKYVMSSMISISMIYCFSFFFLSSYQRLDGKSLQLSTLVSTGPFI